MDLILQRTQWSTVIIFKSLVILFGVSILADVNQSIRQVFILIKFALMQSSTFFSFVQQSAFCVPIACLALCSISLRFVQSWAFRGQARYAVPTGTCTRLHRVPRISSLRSKSPLTGSTASVVIVCLRTNLTTNIVIPQLFSPPRAPPPPACQCSSPAHAVSAPGK